MKKYKKPLFSIVILVCVALAGFYYKSMIGEQKSTEEQSSKIQDTFSIGGVVAVFFDPSQELIDEMKKDNEEDFYTGADDAGYYFVASSDFLRTKNIKIVSTSARYIDFIKDNGQHVLIDRNSKDAEGLSNEYWGVFLFDGKQDPFHADILNIQPDYEKYFE